MSICATRMYRHLSSFEGAGDGNRFTASVYSLPARALALSLHACTIHRTTTNFGIASSTKRTASQPSQNLKLKPTSTGTGTGGVSVDIHVQHDMDMDEYAMKKMPRCITSSLARVL